MEEAVRYGAEFRRCLIDLDIPGIKRLWAHVSPHLPQPATDDEALYSMHFARSSMKTLPRRLRDYSEAWLKERQVGRIVRAVGIAVKAPPERQKLALEIRAAMSESVLDSIHRGLDLETESDEIRRRMLAVRREMHIGD